MTQLTAMLLSIGLEVPALLLCAWWWRDPRRWRIVGVGVLATVVTHPFVWHGIPWLATWIPSWPVRAGLAEVGAAAAEAGLFAWLLRWGRARAALASGLANAWSFGVGLLWFLVLQPALAPRAGCPAPLVEDAERAGRIVRWVGRPVPPRLCFGPEPERGVRDPAGWLRLDAQTDDRLLAARVDHLLLHDDAVVRGRGCVARLRREEARAWARELLTRRALGVEDPGCPVASAVGPGGDAAAIASWLATSPHPRAADLRESHRRRCAP